MTEIHTVPPPKFPLGELRVTAAADRALSPGDIRGALARHERGDWGDLTEGDRELNESGLRDGGRLHSAYRSPAGAEFWVITEWDRSATTVLLPDDY